MRIGTVALALTLACGANSCARTKPAPSVVATAPDANVQEPATPTSAAETPSPAVTPPPAAAPTLASAPPPSRSRVDFATQVRPILESRCQPCHFPGGIMYERLPFDRPETIDTLGTKLFSRIKDEKEAALIRDYLSRQSESSQPRS